MSCGECFATSSHEITSNDPNKMFRNCSRRKYLIQQNCKTNKLQYFNSNFQLYNNKSDKNNSNNFLAESKGHEYYKINDKMNCVRQQGYYKSLLFNKYHKNNQYIALQSNRYFCKNMSQDKLQHSFNYLQLFKKCNNVKNLLGINYLKSIICFIILFLIFIQTAQCTGTSKLLAKFQIESVSAHSIVVKMIATDYANLIETNRNGYETNLQHIETVAPASIPKRKLEMKITIFNLDRLREFRRSELTATVNLNSQVCFFV